MEFQSVPELMAWLHGLGFLPSFGRNDSEEVNKLSGLIEQILLLRKQQGTGNPIIWAPLSIQIDGEQWYGGMKIPEPTDITMWAWHLEDDRLVGGMNLAGREDGTLLLPKGSLLLCTGHLPE